MKTLLFCIVLLSLTSSFAYSQSSQNFRGLVESYKNLKVDGLGVNKLKSSEVTLNFVTCDSVQNQSNYYFTNHYLSITIEYQKKLGYFMFDFDDGYLFSSRRDYDYGFDSDHSWSDADEYGKLIINKDKQKYIYDTLLSLFTQIKNKK